MAGLRGLSALLLIAILTVGTASAAAGNGTLDVTGALALEGPVTSAPDAGTLLVGIDRAGDFAAARDSAIDGTLRAASVNVTRVTWISNAMPGSDGAPPVQAAVYDRPVIEYFDAADAELAATPSADDGARLLYESASFHADGAAVTLQGATLRGITRDYAILNPDAPGREARGDLPPEAAYERVIENAFAATTKAGVAIRGLADEATLYAYGFDVVVRTADGERTFATGETYSAPVGGIPLETERHVTFLVVRLEGADANLTVRGAPATWYETAPNLRVDGALLARDARGLITSGLSEYPVRGGALRVEGDLVIAPERTTEGKEGWDFATAADPAFRAHVSGDVRSVSVAAIPRLSDEAKAAAAAGVVGVVGVALLWPLIKYWLTVAFLPLYSRLNEPEILDNEVRNHIYNIIRENPGISARAVHRAAGQSWGTVVYHLRQLERHHLVTSRRVGRSRNFYENHGKYRGMEVALATLNAPRAVQVAKAILAEPGLTQERLTETTGLPQPTVSYYVRKLRDAELITEAREGRYARYLPIADLARLVAIAAEDDAPGTPTAAQPPVQA